MIEIPLSKRGSKAGKYTAIVSNEDDVSAEKSWQYTAGYASRTVGTPPNRVRIYLHREVIERQIGHPLEAGQQVDHISGDTLDNRRGNLRLATHTENMRNKKKKPTSLYKGVSWNKTNKKWQARIKKGGKVTVLRGFDTPEEAHAAYCEKAKELFGEFARFE